ncbi:methyltransferase domain-containing protein [Ferrimonas sediminicola]|uniref:Methyltransferase domain-containing protein n=1 Tax=Ferrimonas sediminicola TaxID=2569538 RepID=A0A4U1BI09_9GAMM|nr:methyltransferase [Ferrimonas sediminicola]TKB49696.1 methyltransferase domain-containing protein [Ferrimonas sediminicola]
MSEILTLESLDLRLRRFPETQQSELIAWDAADELLMLNALPEVRGRLLIINDHFGALGCAAARLNPIWVNDSFVAHQALKQNLDLNALPRPAHCLADLDQLTEPVDQVWIKLPRNLRYLEHLLDWLNGHLPQGTPVVIAARLKEMPSTLKALTEHYLDEIQPSRIRKKARLLSGVTSNRRASEPLVLTWQAPATEFLLENHPNTFAGQKLDVAAHLMLTHIPHGHRRIIDLGCGNGILALAAAKANPDAHILAVDESWHGVTSCRANLARVLPAERFEVHWDDCLTEVAPASADLVLCNPPFHQQQAVTDHIAWQMFRDAKRALAKGGRLRVIGNRHLGYHIKLNRLFGKVETVAANAKFVILDAIK